MLVRDPRPSWSYVLESDRKLPRGDPARSVFKLKHLTLEQEANIIDDFERDPFTGVSHRRNVGTSHLRALRIGLIGWENVRDERGTEIPFEAGPYGGAKDELLRRLPITVREELAQAIEQEMAYDPEEVGKSEPASGPGMGGSQSPDAP